MEAQTLQQQTPIYHVCQHCGGEGCAACSDLLILDGDIQLDPEWSDEHTVQEQLDWLDAFSERVQLLTKMAPINGVIGTTPDYPLEARLAHVNKLACRMPYRVTNSGLNRDVLCDGVDINGSFNSVSVCRVFSEPARSFDSNRSGHAQAVVQKGKLAAPSPKPAPKYDISFDDRNMYQRREDELRLAGEWEV
ncbi:hypothetical protein ACEUAI_15960 [Aeromonas veronii]